MIYKAWASHTQCVYALTSIQASQAMKLVLYFLAGRSSVLGEDPEQFHSLRSSLSFYWKLKGLCVVI